MFGNKTVSDKQMPPLSHSNRRASGDAVATASKESNSIELQPSDHTQSYADSDAKREDSSSQSLSHNMDFDFQGEDYSKLVIHPSLPSKNVNHQATALDEKIQATSLKTKQAILEEDYSSNQCTVLVVVNQPQRIPVETYFNQKQFVLQIVIEAIKEGASNPVANTGYNALAQWFLQLGKPEEIKALESKLVLSPEMKQQLLKNVRDRFLFQIQKSIVGHLIAFLRAYSSAAALTEKSPSSTSLAISLDRSPGPALPPKIFLRIFPSISHYTDRGILPRQ